MRIVSWNCNMGLHKKYRHLASLASDIAVIPECAEPDILRRRAPGFGFSDCEWQGENPRKGLGVFAFNGLSLRRHQSWDPRYRYFIPIEVRGAVSINLLAIWAQKDAYRGVKPEDPSTRSAVAHYRPFLATAPGVLAGDFNAGVRWDAKPGVGRFCDLDDDLRAMQFESAYHGFHGEAFDQEKSATLVWMKNVEKRYHVDYVYLPTAWRSALTSVKVEDPAQWLDHSDHMPLVVDVALPADAAVRSLNALGADALSLTVAPPAGTKKGTLV